MAQRENGETIRDDKVSVYPLLAILCSRHSVSLALAPSLEDSPSKEKSLARQPILQIWEGDSIVCLPQALAEILKTYVMDVRDLKGIVTLRGPGSFTGTRTQMQFVYGLCAPFIKGISGPRPFFLDRCDVLIRAALDSGFLEKIASREDKCDQEEGREITVVIETGGARAWCQSYNVAMTAQGKLRIKKGQARFVAPADIRAAWVCVDAQRLAEKIPIATVHLFSLDAGDILRCFHKLSVEGKCGFAEETRPIYVP